MGFKPEEFENASFSFSSGQKTFEIRAFRKQYEIAITVLDWTTNARLF